LTRDDYPGDGWCPVLAELAWSAACALLVVLMILAGWW
jgi:hypothetical protein